MKIAVVAAIPAELELLVGHSGARAVSRLGLRETHAGRLGGHDLLLCVTGMGKINAAAATAWLLETHSPDLLISTGCAGAYCGCGLSVGDLCIATAEICGDEGFVDAEGWKPYDAIGIPAVVLNGTRYYNEFPLCGAAAERAAALAASLGIPHRSGRFVTLSTCSGTRERGDELRRRFDALCENMEGGAVAQVALQYGVDCMEVRGVSNLVEDRDLSRWDIAAALERAQRFLLHFLEKGE